MAGSCQSLMIPAEYHSKLEGGNQNPGLIRQKISQRKSADRAKQAVHHGFRLRRARFLETAQALAITDHGQDRFVASSSRAWSEGGPRKRTWVAPPNAGSIEVLGVFTCERRPLQDANLESWASRNWRVVYNCAHLHHLHVPIRSMLRQRLGRLTAFDISDCDLHYSNQHRAGWGTKRAEWWSGPFWPDKGGRIQNASSSCCETLEGLATKAGSLCVSHTWSGTCTTTRY